jgi:crossover junction endodeoxyribonuclease RuvC
VAYGSVRTQANEKTGFRLLQIRNRVLELIEEYRPSHAAVESLFFAKNITSAIPVAQAKGVVLVTLAQAGIEAEEFPPQDIKMAIAGNGRAEKFQVQEMVRILLKLPEVPKPDHAADALACAICLYHKISFPGGRNVQLT